MVYAMFSIGVLGFIVWSQINHLWLVSAEAKQSVVALLFCEEKVINSTVGWKDFMLLNTFYSLDVNNLVQSAGNFVVTSLALTTSLNRGSSETIRGGSFNLFRETYEFYYNKNFEGSNDWLL